MRKAPWIVVLAAAPWAVLVARVMPAPGEAHAAARAPEHLKLVPMSSDRTYGCPGELLHAIRQHPNWTIRVDSMKRRGCGFDPDHRLASITITADSARWDRDDRTRYDEGPWEGTRTPGSTEITAGERDRVLAALDQPCKDEDAKGHSQLAADTYVGIAIDPTADAITSIWISSASTQIADVFDEVQTRYVAEHAAEARGLAIDVSAKTRDGLRFVRVADGHVKLRDARPGYWWDRRDLGDDALVELADCLRELPRDRDPVVTGTFALDGVRVPLAISRASLEQHRCAFPLRWLLGLD